MVLFVAVVSESMEGRAPPTLADSHYTSLPRVLVLVLWSANILTFAERSLLGRHWVISPARTTH